MEINLDELTEEALNAACLVIQNKLGVDSGDRAAIHFSGSEIRNLLQDYIREELEALESDDEDDSDDSE